MPTFPPVRRKGTPLWNTPGQSGSRGLPNDPSYDYRGLGCPVKKREPWPGGKEIGQLEAWEAQQKEIARRKAGAYLHNQQHQNILQHRKQQYNQYIENAERNKEPYKESEETARKRLISELNDKLRKEHDQKVKINIYGQILEECDKAEKKGWLCDFEFYKCKGKALQGLERYNEAMKAFDEAARDLQHYKDDFRRWEMADIVPSIIKNLVALGRFNETITECNKYLENKQPSLYSLHYEDEPELFFYREMALNELLKWFIYPTCDICGKKIKETDHYDECPKNAWHKTSGAFADRVDCHTDNTKCYKIPIFRTLDDIIFIFTQKVPMHNFIQLL